ncbi:hypothetical protein FA95DRAFT_211585 [Auriscalpium vulgare]|uniref:Uncharacterized protein n=1 Tax=Auriscalpium vulgare TaxID=40419 RepID=A0ACB8RMI4_9AGAM|nr:hypothetical protein FA95DRAFT_211585 [Auriscalpium vulgare]
MPVNPSRQFRSIRHCAQRPWDSGVPKVEQNQQLISRGFDAKGAETMRARASRLVVKGCQVKQRLNDLQEQYSGTAAAVRKMAGTCARRHSDTNGSRPGGCLGGNQARGPCRTEPAIAKLQSRCPSRNARSATAWYSACSARLVFAHLGLRSTDYAARPTVVIS